MSSRLAIVFVSVVCFCLTGCGGRADKRVSKANFEKIKPGMTEDEVAQILGPGTEDTGDEGMGSSAAAVGVTGGLDNVRTGTPVFHWIRYGNDYTHIRVCFTRQGKVHDTDFKKEKGLK